MPVRKKTTTDDKTATITIGKLTTDTVTVALVGISPMLCNAMSAKAKHEFLLPSLPKNRAERATTLKHDPEQEYRDSVLMSTGDEAPTRLLLPAPAVKGAMANAALDMPGATKSAMGRLTWVEGYSLPLWGVPKLHMAIVRMAGIVGAPDIRTRACLPRWASVAKISFVIPNLTGQGVLNLLAAGGLICGLGDGRQEKGKLNFGQYRVCSVDDAEFLEIVNSGGREAQDDALGYPECFDRETAELLSWYHDELTRRRGKVAKTKAAAAETDEEE